MQRVPGGYVCGGFAVSGHVKGQRVRRGENVRSEGRGRDEDQRVDLE